ncbi:MAG TPA: patatin-like phospholipase family protein [Chthonomonadaceae bacterium]|nr:patatin-like phospholipase family protein [Chthonomonadaceae bacterium]
MATYRILSLDGGGIRGIFTARLLERIVAAKPNFLSQVHLFAGTSTGAVLAIALAKGLTPAELVGLYRDRGRDIFHDDLLHNIGDLWGLVGARYSTENRYKNIYPYIGDITLNDLLPKHVLVATYQLDSQNPIDPVPPGKPQTWKAKFFHNYEGPDSDGPQRAIDVIMRSTAAPTYFPIYQGFIDGGVVANNPSMCALAQAINPQVGGKQRLEDVVLMSIGTGMRLRNIKSRDGDWGLKQWGFTIVELLFEAGIGLADYQCQQLLDDCYIRLNPDLGEDIGLDAVDRIDTLLAKANEFPLDPVLQWIGRQWDKA